MPATETRKSSKRSKNVKTQDLEAIKANLKKEITDELERKREEEELSEELERESTSIFTNPGTEFIEDEAEDPMVLQERQERENTFDIFESMEANYVRNGTSVSYLIKKDNAIIGEHVHPCTWITLQKKYGGGIYQVIARHALSKKYIKSQTQVVAELEKPKEVDEPIVQVQQLPPQSTGPDLTTMFTTMTGMFQQMLEMNEKTKQREEKEERSANTEISKAIFDSIKSQSTSNMTLFMEMMKINQEQTKSLAETMAKAMEKMDERFNKAIEKISEKKDKSLDAIQLITLIKESENSGWSKAVEFLEMVEQKSSEKDGGEKSSLTEKLLTAVLTGVMQKGAGLPSSSALPPQNYQPTALPQNSAPPKPSTAPHAPQHPRPAHPGTAPKATTQAAKKGPGPAIVATSKPVEAQRQKEIIVDEEGDINALMNKASHDQKTIATIAVPKIGELLFNKKVSPRDAANIVLDDLKSQGFGADVVLKEFTFDFMWKVAKAIGVGSEQKPWLEEFYAGFEDSARMGDPGAGEHSASEQQANL